MSTLFSDFSLYHGLSLLVASAVATWLLLATRPAPQPHKARIRYRVTRGRLRQLDCHH